MAYVNYSAKRNLVGGHVIGNSYDLEFSPAILEPDRDISKHDSESDDGTIETQYSYGRDIWEVETISIVYGSANYDLWREFLDSVEGSEQFTFDPFGTIASPDNPVQVKLKGDYKPKRKNYNNFTFSFKVVPA